MLDKFFDSGEVSGDGHVWSNAAIGTDYLEKTWQQAYRGNQRTYDFEGAVAKGYPLLQKIPDVNEPASGYLWGDLAAHGKTYYHFGEFISTIFCTDAVVAICRPIRSRGRMMPGAACDTQIHCARGGHPRRMGRRRQQVAVADSAHRRQHRDQARTRWPFCSRGSGLRACRFPTRFAWKSSSVI